MSDTDWKQVVESGKALRYWPDEPDTHVEPEQESEPADEWAAIRRTPVENQYWKNPMLRRLKRRID